MPLISQYYEIAGALEFEDLDVNTDNLRFLDPRVIRALAASSPDAREAMTSLESFFDVIVKCICDPSPANRRRGRSLLCHFHEPKQLRLGMAQKGFQGHGTAKDLGHEIWRQISEDTKMLIEVGVFKRLEAVPVYVVNIAEDRTSDIVGRIIFGTLCRFTERMVERYPELRTTKPRSVRVQVWDSHQLSWSAEKFELPAPNGKPLVLIPKGWTRSHLQMTHTRYFDKAILDYAQSKATWVDADGRPQTLSKKMLKRQSPFDRGQGVIVEQTVAALEDGWNLMEHFDHFVISNLSL